MSPGVKADTDQGIDTSNASQFLGHAERLADFGCFDWDIRSNQVQWSDGLYRIFGLKPHEFEATLEAFLERVVPEDREQVLADIQDALGRCDSFSGTERIRRASGEIRHLHSRGEVITNADGEPIRLIGVCQDITATKQLESELRHSQKMEAVGRLAAGVAHDFNNLLTVIDINAHILTKEPSKDARIQQITAIRDASERAGKLVSQLLVFSKKGQRDTQVIAINDRILRTRNLLKSLIGDRHFLELDLADDLPSIQIDQSHLDQIFVNLTVNAREAMQDSGTLKIATYTVQVENQSNQQEGNAKTFVVFSVSDTGVGMAPEDCSRAFEPFYTTKAEGSGLGLSVVYGVAEECGGQVHLDSELGVGTTCKVYLPASDKLPEPNQVSNQLEAIGSERILLVEDDPNVRTAMAKMLQIGGFEVIEAEHADDALQVAAALNGQLDLLLSDVRMPGLTGPELAERLVAEIPSLAVLLVTGYDGRLDTNFPHLNKPFSSNDLMQQVRSTLDAKAKR